MGSECNLGGHFEKDGIFFSDPSSASESPGSSTSLSRRHSGFSAAREKRLRQTQPDLFRREVFARLDEDLGRHHLTQEINLSNSHVAGYYRFRRPPACLPLRTDSSSRPSDAGCRDTAAVGQPQ